MLVATKSFFIFFLPLPPSFPCFLHCDLFSQKKCSDQKAYLAKDKSAQRPHLPFLGTPAAIWDFAGGAPLQAVSECSRRR